MKIEMRKNYILINGEKKENTNIFKYKTGWKTNKPTYLDLRNTEMLRDKNIEFINHSGRNYEIIGINDWHCTLKTNMKITSTKGVMPYMGQTYIS